MSDSTEVRVEVLQVPPGSLVVLRNVHFGEDGYKYLCDELERIVGHDRFLVVNLDAGASLEVVDQAEALKLFGPGS